MTLPRADTVVLYPSGATTASAAVLHVAELGDGRAAVLLDRTPAHPVDAAWPDQGPDLGALVSASTGARVTLLDVAVAATDGEHLHLGADSPVRTGTEGWAFVVAHVVEAGLAAAEGIVAGAQVEVVVDADHRRALSLGHTACHLASLALNSELASAWRKVGRIDALEAPDFDGTAIASSTITPGGSIDVYRVGRSVRKAGFDPASLDDTAGLAARIEARLAAWIASGGVVRIEAEGSGLTDRRSWVAELPDAAGGVARIPCGGTHAGSLAELGRLTVALDAVDVEGAVQLTMITRSSAS